MTVETSTRKAPFVGDGSATLSFPLGFTIRSKAGSPTTSDLPDGQFQVWNDTSGGSVKLWVNDGGTLKSVTLS